MGHYTDEEKTALTNLGFEPRKGAYAKIWTDGGQSHFTELQIITIAKLETDWSFVWQRGFTYTIDERRAPTLPLLVEQLWEVIFTRSERYLELVREQAKWIVNRGKTVTVDSIDSDQVDGVAGELAKDK